MFPVLLCHGEAEDLMCEGIWVPSSSFSPSFRRDRGSWVLQPQSSPGSAFSVDVAEHPECRLRQRPPSRFLSGSPLAK